MNKAELEAILRGWSFWDRPLPETVPREVDWPNKLVNDLVLVVQGVRRCGKSTLLTQVVGQYQLDKKDCFFVNFEDPRLVSNLDHELLDTITELAHQMRPKSQKHYFFLDEIQNVSHWEKWLHARLERPTGDHFIVTGSNASLLSGELGSRLTGRHLTIELFPFSWQEYKYSTRNASFEVFLREGGFPRALVSGEPNKLLQAYFGDIIERDIRERVKAKSSQPIKQLLQMVYESCGSELSLRKIAAASGVSADTAGHYIEMSESSYLIGSCPYFSYSSKQSMTRNKKYYPIDTGLRCAVVTKVGQDLGKHLETICYWHLRRKCGTGVYYWRDKGEVDFVTREGAEIQPYQVSWDGVKERHEKALDNFYQHFPQANDPIYVTKKTVCQLVSE